VNPAELSSAVSKMVSETLDVLSVSVWFADDAQRRLTLGGSTALYGARAREMANAGKSARAFLLYLREHPGLIDLQEHPMAWPREIMEAGAEYSRHPVHCDRSAGARKMVSVMTLMTASGKQRTFRRTSRYRNHGGQLASGLLNLKLSDQLGIRRVKRSTVSTFFIHDLKNTACGFLNDAESAGKFVPEFRADALRMISRSIADIDRIYRACRCFRKARLKLGPCDLTSWSLKSKLQDQSQGRPAAGPAAMPRYAWTQDRFTRS
jgi:hypothetical protein